MWLCVSVVKCKTSWWCLYVGILHYDERGKVILNNPLCRVAGKPLKTCTWISVPLFACMFVCDNGDCKNDDCNLQSCICSFVV